MSTVILRTKNKSQREIFLKLARELGVSASVVTDANEEKIEKKLLLMMSESSFAKDWLSKEDDHWDELLKKK